MEDWAEIRTLHRRDGLSKREIDRRLGISQVTVGGLAKRRTPVLLWLRGRHSLQGLRGAWLPGHSAGATLRELKRDHRVINRGPAARRA